MTSQPLFLQLILIYSWYYPKKIIAEERKNIQENKEFEEFEDSQIKLLQNFIFFYDSMSRREEYRR